MVHELVFLSCVSKEKQVSWYVSVHMGHRYMVLSDASEIGTGSFELGRGWKSTARTEQKKT